MKSIFIFATVICMLFTGCTIPCDIFFRNLSGETVQLKGRLVDGFRFEKLPSKANFYDTAKNSKQIYGKWKYEKLVAWADSTNFNIDIPPYSIIDVSDVSRGLTLGGKSPDVLLVVFSGNKADTLTTGDYLSLAAKFRVKRIFLSKPVYYYDFKNKAM